MIDKVIAGALVFGVLAIGDLIASFGYRFVYLANWKQRLVILLVIAMTYFMVLLGVKTMREGLIMIRRSLRDESKNIH